MEKTIKYGNSIIYVNDEVAQFLEKDRKLIQAQCRSDSRHLSKSSFEQVETTAKRRIIADPIFNIVSRNLTLEKLHKAIDTLSADEKDLICLYYYKHLTMEQIGTLFGVSKMAISKRHKKLISKLRNLMEA